MEKTMHKVGPALNELRAAYVALRRADRQREVDLGLPFIPVLDRPDLQPRRGGDVRLSRRATPAVSLHLARMRAAWEMLPDVLRRKAHLVLTVEKGRSS
jgi:hypothetical protein